MIKGSGEHPDVGALITGAGTAFCSAGDVKAWAATPPRRPLSFGAKVVRLQQRQRTLTGALVSVRKPTSRRGASGVQVALPQPLIAFERRGCRSVDQVRKLRSRHWSSLPIKFL
jgi:hypothetical protein